MLTIGPYYFSPGARMLLEPMENRTNRLTVKEVTILKCVHRATGRPVSHQALLHEVWRYNESVRTHTVETHMYRLRRKIEPDPSRPINNSGRYYLGRDCVAGSCWSPPLQLAMAADS